jgi:enoyl-CoA hydratase/carnithine racemase
MSCGRSGVVLLGTTATNTTGNGSVVQVIDFSTVSNRQPLQPLDATVRRFIYENIHASAANPQITAIVLTGGTVNFSTGADVTEFAGWIRNLQKQSNTSSSASSLPAWDVSSSSFFFAG